MRTIMKTPSLFSATILGCLLLCSPGPGQARAAQPALTYVDLVDHLTDLQRLATLPPEGDLCSQWSSYDRKSRYDAVTDKYVNWDANGDGNGFIRKEDGKFVLAEMQGPGCIWRIWSATPAQGHVRIYLDGTAEPAVDLPFKGYFDGNNAPFTRSAIVHTVSRGWNNYTPIPYQTSCKIVADPGWGQYYHFTYETFPPHTQVPTFKRDLAPDESAALDRANDILTQCGSAASAPAPGQKTIEKSLRLSPGGTATLARLKGPEAITRLRMKLDLPPAPADRDILRGLVLQIRWDGEKEPSVWAPLGDFFGTAPGANPYRSLPLGLTTDGWWYCNWYMPFAKNAVIQLVNEGAKPQRIAFQLQHAPLSLPVRQLARFHAKWHRDAFLPTEKERAIDWPFLKTTGQGRFVGVMLHIWNPRGGWWGEGDEKFFVDGEKFPSTFGTGSEDYFGYAWSNPSPFQHAYHNQTHNDGNSKGHISVNRWEIPESVPFQKSFEGCIEKYYSNQRPTLYATMAYWYLAPGGSDPYRPVPLNQRIGYDIPIQTQASKIPGALEGETLKVLSKTGGDPQPQDMTGFGGQWSNDSHLWWIHAKPGDHLELALPVSKPGKYNLAMQFTKAPDYAVVQLYLDDQKLGDPIDLYNPGVVPSGVLPMGTHELSAGQHRLKVEILGANEKAIKNFMFGLDYVKLEKLSNPY